MTLTEDKLMILKQSPRQCSITDIEDLCDGVEQLNAALIQAMMDIQAIKLCLHSRDHDIADTIINRIQAAILRK